MRHRRRSSLPSKKFVSRFRDCLVIIVWQKSSLDWASSSSSFVRRTGTSAIETPLPSSWYARAISNISISSSRTSSSASSSLIVLFLSWIRSKSVINRSSSLMSAAFVVLFLRVSFVPRFLCFLWFVSFAGSLVLRSSSQLSVLLLRERFRVHHTWVLRRQLACYHSRRGLGRATGHREPGESRSIFHSEVEFAQAESPTHQPSSRVGNRHQPRECVVVRPYDERKSFDIRSQRRYAPHNLIAFAFGRRVISFRIA